MVQAPISVSKTHRNVIAGAAVNPAAQTSLGAEGSDAKSATFRALSGNFELTDDEFSERFLPWVRLAFALVQRDFIGVDALVRDMVRQDGKGRLDEAERAWTGCAEAFGTIIEFVEAAQVRLAVVRTQTHSRRRHLRRSQ